MQISTEELKDSNTKVTVGVDKESIADAKRQVLGQLRPEVKAPGFREGKAPDNVVEKQLGAEYVQNLVLERAVGRAYSQAIDDKKLKPLGQPQINITKFVPYSELEFEAEVEVVPNFSLPDYKNLKIDTPDSEEVAEKDVDEVIENIRTRIAESKEVDRAAKDGDKAWIDFKGTRADNDEEVKGATGEDYPIVLGSNTFIKGFEPEVVGMKPGEEKDFTVTFPEDYHVKALQDQKVNFHVTLKKVEEIIKPDVNDEFAKKAGPFENLESLKKDIKSQLEQEQQQRASREFREAVIEKLVEKTKLDVPPQLQERVKQEIRQEMEQNLQYRGTTLAQYIEQQGLSEEEFEQKELTEKANKRAKASLILTEVAEQEKIDINREELEERLQMLRQQYSDEKMQAELDKPEARRELAAQLMTEKTIQKLIEFNT